MGANSQSLAAFYDDAISFHRMRDNGLLDVINVVLVA